MLSIKKLLYKILTTIKTPIKVVKVTGSTISAKEGTTYQLNPPTQSGYTFLCWLYGNADGWSVATTSANPLVGTSLWYVVRCATSDPSTSHNITPNGFALYIRSSIA